MASVNFEIKDYVDPKFLIIGLGGVLGLYLLLFVYSMFAGPSLFRGIEARLTHKAVEIKSVASSKGGYSGSEHAVKAPPPAPLVAKYDAVQEVDGLFETAAVGRLPQIRGHDGLTPFDAYKKSSAVAQGKARIAIVLVDIGLSKSLSSRAVDSIPEEVSLVVSPYADNLDYWQRAISGQGHEMWLSVPMEDVRYPMSEPGSQGVLSRSSVSYNKERLLWALSRTHGYAGVAMYTDEAFAKVQNIIISLTGEVFARGLGYLELNPSSPYGLDAVAAGVDAPYFMNSVGGQNALFDEVIDMVEDNAATGSVAIAVLPATPVNLVAIAAWAQSIEEKNIVLVPLSAASDMSQDSYMSPAPAPVVEDAAENVVHDQQHH